MTTPSFNNVAALVQEFTGLRSNRSITPETRIEVDLGVTGDDGVDLIEHIEGHFNVTLTSEKHGVRRAFNLGPNEYLFGAEGFDLFRISDLIRWIRKEPKPVIRDLTVGELHEALLQTIESENENAT